MIEEKVECKRLGYEYKDLFEKIVYFIHHTPFAKDFISDYDLKMLSDLDLFLHTGKYEIIEFGTNKTRFDSSNIIKEQKEEITRSNNIINELEKYFEEEQTRLERECSNIYEDSLGKTKLVNEDIFNEITRIKDKLKELKEGKYEKSI